MYPRLTSALASAFACSVLAALVPHSARAQASIEVVSSLVRDGIDVPNNRQQIGIADDGTIAFAANTPFGTERLLIAFGGSLDDLGLSARTGSDIAINDDSIVYISGAQVLALR